MKFVDEIILEACSGKGGDGVVKWKSLPGKPRGGPGGGDGGNGGNVFIKAVRDVGLLSRYRGNNKFIAPDGGNGGKASMYGGNGEDVYIKLPIGSVVRDDFDNEFELLTEGQEIKILRGGAGGYGNEHFKSSRNVAPTECTEGKPGVCSRLYVELRLVADAGFIGFPNAGKSTLLNSLTNASAKTGDYAFTTLDPNLGDMFGYILADIPGIIEGASSGRGLGDKFLRHVMRTKRLIHCISVERDDVKEAYKSIKTELGNFNALLLEKPEIVLLTKTDMVSHDEVTQKLSDLEEMGISALPVSVENPEDIKQLQNTLIHLLQESESSLE